MGENSAPDGDPKIGALSVRSLPSDDAPVLLDGTATGKSTPATLEDLKAGKHTVAVQLPDCTVISREVTVASGKTLTVCLKQLSKEEQGRVFRIAAYTGGFVVVLTALAIFDRLYLGSLDNLTRLIIYIACSGGLGSLAYSIFGYIDHNGKNDFDLNYFWWYILRPFIGIIYGTFAFLFVAGGLMTLSGVTADTTLFTTKTAMFYCALAFLAGYAEHAFSLQLKELAEALFKKEGSK
ncbi:MAG: PEGA domain-containing protein [Methanoregula sp.]|jgi:hypothetical protein